MRFFLVSQIADLNVLPTIFIPMTFLNDERAVAGFGGSKTALRCCVEKTLSRNPITCFRCRAQGVLAASALQSQPE
ncbi:hypothetical protein METHP14_910004 [Pseudomonas sp. P14-2025]